MRNNSEAIESMADESTEGSWEHPAREGTRRDRAGRTSIGNLEFAILGLIARHADGAHGYQLKQELDSLCDDFWQINYGRLYRVLEMLARAGRVHLTQQAQSGRPTRKVYRVTERGLVALSQWLAQPVAANPRPLRDELALKLLFLDPSDLDAFNMHIKQQRSICLTRLARVARRRKRLDKANLGTKALDLIMDGPELRVQADLAWLERMEGRIVRTF